MRWNSNARALYSAAVFMCAPRPVNGRYRKWPGQTSGRNKCVYSLPSMRRAPLSRGSCYLLRGVAGVGLVGVSVPLGLLWVTDGVVLLAVVVRSPLPLNSMKPPTMRRANAAITPHIVPDLRRLASMVLLIGRFGSLLNVMAFSNGCSD